MERGPAIVLIGFMGAGKSTVGRELSRLTALPRYDTDEMVITQARRSIAEIFAAGGEEDFRRWESEALAHIPHGAAIVITGGGIVLRAENVEQLRRLGFVIHLTATEETLFTRASRNGVRPLLKTANPRATMATLLSAREPLYRAAADFTVDTSQLEPEKVAATITTWINANE